MTVHEFEAWVDEHRNELLAVAKKRVAKAREHNVELDPDDILQDALVEMVKRFEGITGGYWTYAVKAIRSQANVAQASEVARYKYQMAAANDEVPPATLRARELNKLPRNGKGQIDPTAPSIPLDTALAPTWDGPMPGVARWRFQTLRDDRLFMTRAIHSQWNSLWAAAKRPVYGLERGHSFTEFGQEATK